MCWNLLTVGTSFSRGCWETFFFCFSGLFISIPNPKHQQLSWNNFCMDLICKFWKFSQAQKWARVQTSRGPNDLGPKWVRGPNEEWSEKTLLQFKFLPALWRTNVRWCNLHFFLPLSTGLLYCDWFKSKRISKRGVLKIY